MNVLPPQSVLDRIHAGLPQARVELVNNPGPSGQHALLVHREDARQVAEFLKNDPELLLDYASNVSGADYPEYLEAVYHLFSIAQKHGPIVLKTRTGDRGADATVPSLTPVWKSADFQEREAYDLFGIRFEGHPDLRRLLMWEEFADFPLRKDYAAPADYEYEPTPHGDIVQKAAATTQA
ncbi:MAG: NADH-quinone oxidoreductase subunit C [Verrucomicrobiota bacterium]